MAKISIGIVGLPNVGKSTLFKILTKQDITIANYPFATIDPNVGVVTVPDDRVDRLAELSKSKKKIPAVVEFYDIAGLVKGANQGEGLGNQFLGHIRETQAIVIVLRVFRDPDIIHVENSVDPLRDLDIILTELVLKDLEAVEKRHARAEAEARTGKKEAIAERDRLAGVKAILAEGRTLAAAAAASDDVAELIRNDRLIRELNLLTAKRQIFLLNGSPEDVSEALRSRIAELGGGAVVADLASVESVPELISKAYAVLNLASFFTTGEDETRAWTIERGMLAPQAAGVIHTDFEEKFIRLEAIACDQLLAAGGWTQAKQKGLIRLEGKTYEVKDGDVIVVRHG